MYNPWLLLFYFNYNFYNLVANVQSFFKVISNFLTAWIVYIWTPVKYSSTSHYSLLPPPAGSKTVMLLLLNVLNHCQCVHACVSFFVSLYAYCTCMCVCVCVITVHREMFSHSPPTANVDLSPTPTVSPAPGRLSCERAERQQQHGGSKPRRTALHITTSTNNQPSFGQPAVHL